MYGSKNCIDLGCTLLKWYKCDAIHELLPKNETPLKMGKIVVLVLIATAAAMASRDVRSPGGSGWQASSGFGGAPSVGLARSSGGSWASSGGGLGRSANNGGWGGNSAFGSNSRSRSGNGNRSPSSSGWSQSGYSSNGGYGGNSLRSSPGWNDRFGDSSVIESLDSSNGWDESNLGFRSNNGWQSSAW